MLSAMLKHLGYDSVPASSGQEALQIFSEARAVGKTFDAVILDLTIPGGLGGKEVAEEIRRSDAVTPLFVSSGYTGDPVIADPKAFGFTDSLRKPFTINELSAIFAKNLKKRT
jgi:CheY-like chemotaxis protein